MIDIQLHSVLTLDDNQKYVVVSKLEYQGADYDYLVQLSSNDESLTEHVLITKEEKNGNQIFVEKVEDESKLELLASLFYRRISEQL